MAMEIIPWVYLERLTPGVLVSLIVLLVLLGWLLPKRTYDTMVEQKRQWRETAQKQQETINTQAETIRVLSDGNDTVQAVMDAIQEANSKGGGSG